LDKLILIYQDDWVVRYVQRKVDEVSHEISNTEKLENAIYKQLERYFGSQPKRSIKRIRHLVDREISQARKRYGKQNTILFSDLAVANDSGETELEFEPKDALASVEETALNNSSFTEKVTALASSDRELYVLKAWAHGATDSEISLALASVFGGNPKSLRVFVNRFKSRCRAQLSA